MTGIRPKGIWGMRERKSEAALSAQRTKANAIDWHPEQHVYSISEGNSTGLKYLL
jgi:hypothetical protein